MQNQPTDIFEEGIFGYGDRPPKPQFTPEEIARAKQVAAPAERPDPPTPQKPPEHLGKERDAIIAIIDAIPNHTNQAVVLANVLRQEFTPEARKYIYELSLKQVK